MNKEPRLRTLPAVVVASVAALAVAGCGIPTPSDALDKAEPVLTVPTDQLEP